MPPRHQEDSNAGDEKNQPKDCRKPEARDAAAHVEIWPVTRGEPRHVDYKVEQANENERIRSSFHIEDTLG